VCWIGSPRDVVLRTRSQSQLLFGGPGCANFFKCDKGAKVGPLGHVILPRSTREASWSLGHLGDFEKVVRAPGRDGPHPASTFARRCATNSLASSFVSLRLNEPRVRLPPAGLVHCKSFLEQKEGPSSNKSAWPSGSLTIAARAPDLSVTIPGETNRTCLRCSILTSCGK
jgi:hypothetical protein